MTQDRSALVQWMCGVSALTFTILAIQSLADLVVAFVDSSPWGAVWELVAMLATGYLACTAAALWYEFRHDRMRATREVSQWKQ